MVTNHQPDEPQGASAAGPAPAYSPASADPAGPAATLDWRHREAAMRANRSGSLDCLRALMLFGVLAMNAQYFFNPIDGVYEIYLWGQDVFSNALLFLLRTFIEYKAWYLFGCLFGYFLSRSFEPGRMAVDPWRPLRRMAFLALVGCLHVCFLSSVDILLCWSLCGLALWALHRQSSSRLVAAWIAFQVLVFVSSSSPIVGEISSSSPLELRASASAIEIYRILYFDAATAAGQGATYARTLIYLSGWSTMLPFAMSACLLGLLVRRHRDWASGALLRRLRSFSALAAALLLALSWGLLRSVSLPFRPSVSGLAEKIIFAAATPFVAVVFGVHLYRVAAQCPTGLQAALAAVGRHTLAHYLLQSGLMTAIAATHLIPVGQPLYTMAITVVIVIIHLVIGHATRGTAVPVPAPARG